MGLSIPVESQGPLAGVASRTKSFSFRRLLEKQSSRMEVIVTFLIILELMKTGKISICQENIFDDIIITSNL